jgi:hypothetical protein
VVFRSFAAGAPPPANVEAQPHRMRLRHKTSALASGVGLGLLFVLMALFFVCFVSTRIKCHFLTIFRAKCAVHYRKGPLVPEIFHNFPDILGSQFSAFFLTFFCHFRPFVDFFKG